MSIAPPPIHSSAARDAAAPRVGASLVGAPAAPPVRHGWLAIFLYFAIALVPLANMTLHFVPEAKLGGIFEEKLRPAFTTKTFLDEGFQKGFTGWFDEHYGLRSYAIEADNTATLWLTGETTGISRVRVGTEGTLFVDEDIEYWNRAPKPTEKDIETSADILARMQSLAASKGIHLVPVISPSKTAIYPESVGRWARRIDGERPVDHVYGRFVDEARKRGTKLVDARGLLTETHRKNSADPLYQRGGRHWNARGACLVFLEMLDVLKEIGSTMVEPSHACTGGTILRGQRHNDDMDLVRLLNVAPGLEEPYDAWVLPSTSPREPLSKKTALWVGTSMAWTLIYEAHRRGTFETMEFYYYNRSHYAWPTTRQIEHPPHALDVSSEEWRALTLSRDVIFLEIPEWYLPWMADEFLLSIEGRLQALP